MGFVDTPCHASLQWYEPVETLLYEMDRNEVDQAVLIQINGQYDNRYQQECVLRYPERLSSVALVDPLQPDAVTTLERPPLCIDQFAARSDADRTLIFGDTARSVFGIRR